MIFPRYEYDDDEDKRGYHDWYDQPDYYVYRGKFNEPKQINLLKIWFLGSLFSDLGEWDLFPDK